MAYSFIRINEILFELRRELGSYAIILRISEGGTRQWDRREREKRKKIPPIRYNNNNNNSLNRNEITIIIIYARAYERGGKKTRVYR